MIAWLIVVALFAGVAAGECWFRLRRANDRITWVLRGQEQAELVHGWHRPVDGVPVPTPRKRSPDEQFVDRVVSERMPRPVFDDPR